ncbi:MAG: MFS transporter [Bacilli bacterium]|nr:MFS transporter [Bacilli bacterium]
MNLFGIEINAQNVALAFTIVFLIFVVLNGFLGFLRGTKKSIFYLIVSAVVFGLGFGLMTIAISALMKMPVGKWFGGMLSSVYPEVSATSSMEDIVLGVISNQFPQFAQAVQDGSVTASFVLGLISFVVKLVYIILILVLAFTLFKLIADIIWLIIRPKKVDGVRPKKTFGGRMIGFGIGAAKGAIYSLLIFTLIAGVASVATSAMAVAETTSSSNNTEAVLVLSDGRASLITLDASEGNSGSSGSLFGDMDMEFLASIVGAYRKSVPGALFGAVKVSSVPFDEFLFDGVFSFDVKMGDEKVKVKLRSEIESVANAFAKVANEFDIQNPSLEAILSIGEEGEKALKELVDAISDLSILKVAIPVALEIGLYSDLLVDENGNKLLEEFYTGDQIPTIANALVSDIKSIGYSLVDARKVIAVFVGDSENTKDINTFLNLDPEAIKLLFDEEHLGGLDTVDILAPIGLTYLTTIESVKTALDEIGIDLEQITNMPEGSSWSGEIGKLGDIYIALQDLLKDPETGRVFIDKDHYTEILNLFTEEKVNNFVDTLFTSNLINNAAGALVTFAREKLLPEDYKQYITIGEGVKFDANECKAFLNAATCLVKSGFLSMFGEDGGGNIADMIENLDVDDLAKYLSQSVIIRQSLSGSLDLLLSNLSTGDMQLRFGTFEDWDDAASTEVELRSVLKAMKILGKNLFNSDGENTGFSINTLAGLTEAEIEAILTSKIMRGTIVNFLVDNSGEGQTLSVIGKGVTRVNANPDSWYDQYRILENATLTGNTLNITPTSAAIDQEYLVNHYLIYCNGAYLASARCVAGEAASIDLSTIKVGKDESGNPIYHTPSSTNEYTAYGVNVRGMGVEAYTISGTTLNINPAHISLDNENKVNKINVYADGELIYSVRINEVAPLSIDLSTIKVGENESHEPVYFELKEDTEIEVYGYNEGELRKIFIAILSITSKLGDEGLDFSNTDALTSALSKVDDSDIENITASVVINDALISAIEDLSKQDDAFIYIPSELKDGEGKIDHDKWDEAYESANILKAIKAIFNGGNVSADNLKLKQIIDSKDSILKSLIICETVKQNIVKIDSINVPANEGLGVTDLTGWKNTYNPDGTVATHGELSIMLDAITKVLTITDETSINNISADNLKLKSIIDNRDAILRSKVISETIRSKLLDIDGINIPTGEELSSTDLTGWKNTYDEAGNVLSHGELSYILNAISYVLNISDETTIDGISTDSLKIKSVIDNSDEILKSLVISETIRVKLLEVEGISIPANEELSTDNLTGWKNTYNNDGTVATRAELSALLNAVGYVINIDEDTQINNISTDAIKLNSIIGHKNDILKSLVISETIRVKLMEVDGIDVPANEGLSETDLAGWKNSYNADGTVATARELSALLDAVNIVLNVTDETTVNNIDTNSIKLKNVITNRDTILKSKVISETIRKKLLEVEGIDIPTGEGLSTTDLTGWKNTYNDNGTVATRAELNALLVAVDIVLNVNDDTTINNISTTSIKLKPVIDNRDDILKSLVISETIRKKLLEVDGINVPANESLSSDSLAGWKSTYNANGTVNKRAELAYLLGAVGIVLNVNDETTIDTINTDSIKLKPVIDNKDEILKSLVISETIRVKLLEVEGINIPTGEELSSTDLTGWKSTYTDDGTLESRAELAHLLGAVGKVLNVNDETTINSISTDSIKLKPIVDYRDEILTSLVISETIRKKLLEVDGINIPSGEDLSSTNLDGWKSTYNDDDTVAARAELAHLIGAVGKVLNVTEETTINNIDTNSIKLKNVIDNKDDILKSLVISETIRTKLLAVEGIEVPNNEGLSTTGLAGWKNTYNDSDELTSRAELSYLLASVGIVLDVNNDTTINNINTDNIKLKKVIDYRDEILKSKVICGTIKIKLLEINDIEIPADEGLSETDLTGWKNTYKANGDVNTYGEISKLLYSLNFIIAVDENTTISSINTNSIRLKALISHTDEALRSVVLTNTIKTKLLAPSTGITAPANEGLSETNLTGWKNIYNADETVNTHGEIDSLLKSVDYILDLEDDTSIDTLNVSTIKLQRITTNRDNILRSVVITNTIKTKLLAVEGINIPEGEGLGTDDLTGWKNIYNDDETLASHGEISYILGAIELALDVDEDTTLNSVNTNDIKVKKLITNRDQILLSLVLADTIRVKLNGISGVSIPTGDGVSATNLTGWKNTYNEDEEVTAHGEMSRLLAAIDIMFAPTDDTKVDGMNVDTISLKHIIDNRVEILKSLVLADTIRVKVCAPETGVYVPTDQGLSTTNLTGWKNTYDGEYATAYGELNYLLAAIDEVLHPTESTKLNNIAVSIKMGSIIDGKTIILHSKVIAETIKTKIIEASSTGTLKLPKNYAVELSPNFITWVNTYNDTYNDSTHIITANLTAQGELDCLLTSVGDLLKDEDREKEFSAIGALDYAKLFDPLCQRNIVSSRIISETIITRLEGVAALSIPNSTHVELKSLEDRTAWWDVDTGEIIYFLNSVGSLLTDEQKSNLDSFNLDINTVYANLTDEAARTVLLSSYVISDTLRVNFMSVDALSTVPTVANAGVDLVNDLDAWYLISEDRSTVSHKELWNLIASIKLLLGDDFNEAKTFTLDDLLNNDDFIPALDANKVNTNTNVHTFLQSKMIEQVFVDLAKSILTGEGVMADYINEPYGGYVWYEHIYTTTYREDDRFEYDLQTILESLYEMNAAGLNYSTFGGSASQIATALASVNRAKLADAFVISRTFRGSIQKTFNGIFETPYTAAYAIGLYNGHPIDSWATVALVQADYDEPVTKASASATLKTNIDTIVNNIGSVNG